MRGDNFSENRRGTRPRCSRAAAKCGQAPGRRALLRAGADVIAGRGFEAATMAEIAARAGAPNRLALPVLSGQGRPGPTPSSCVIANSSRPHSRRTDSRAASSTVEEFADDLMSVFAGVRGETPCIVASTRCAIRRNRLARRFPRARTPRVVTSLKLRDRTLGDEQANDMAVVLLQNMKAVKSLDVRTERWRHRRTPHDDRALPKEQTRPLAAVYQSRS